MEQRKQKWFSDGLPNEIGGFWNETFEMQKVKCFFVKRFSQNWNGLDCFQIVQTPILKRIRLI